MPITLSYVRIKDTPTNKDIEDIIEGIQSSKTGGHIHDQNGCE